MEWMGVSQLEQAKLPSWIRKAGRLLLDGLKAKTPLPKRRIILQETCKNLHRLKRKQWKPTSSYLGIGNHRGI